MKNLILVPTNKTAPNFPFCFAFSKNSSEVSSETSKFYRVCLTTLSNLIYIYIYIPFFGDKAWKIFQTSTDEDICNNQKILKFPHALALVKKDARGICIDLFLRPFQNGNIGKLLDI